MKYVSTRGGVKDASFEDAVFTGYAHDGGIILPEVIPCVSESDLHAWKDLSFVELAKKLLPYFISTEEIPADDLNSLYNFKLALKYTYCLKLVPLCTTDPSC